MHSIADSGTGRRVLLVEDDLDTAEVVCELMAVLGHTSVHVAHGEHAVNAATDFDPEVALIDLGLPGVDGYEVARRLRAWAGRRHLVMHALTGWNRPDEMRRIAAAGFASHVLKPVDLATLGRVIRPRSSAPPRRRRTDAGMLA